MPGEFFYWGYAFPGDEASIYGTGFICGYYHLLRFRFFYTVSGYVIHTNKLQKCVKWCIIYVGSKKREGK